MLRPFSSSLTCLSDILGCEDLVPLILNLNRKVLQVPRLGLTLSPATVPRNEKSEGADRP